MKIVCIHQPDFVPYLGFFQRLLIAQHFILLDDVQFIRRGWQHRDQIKSKQGPQWLTLSLKKGDYHQKIHDVELSPEDGWIRDQLNLLKECYGKAPHFATIFPRVQEVYERRHSKMMDLNRAFLDLALEIFGITIPTTLASSYGVQSTSTARLLDLTRAAGGDTYLTGTGSRDYLDEAMFRDAGVQVLWQNFQHPQYPQVFGDFVPMLSCLDLFFNCGPESGAVLRSTLK